MSIILPKYVSFKSEKNKKYLRYKNDSTLTHGFLKFDGEDVMDPYAQFEVSDANIGGGFVHLKCRYTNLYLVRWSRSYYWINASANEPNEDQTTWGCTLFKPTIIEDFGNTKKIRLLHVQVGSYLCLSVTHLASYESCLLANFKEPDPNSFDVFTAVDWESLFKLPKRVAFKGNNGFYLGPLIVGGRPALQFSFQEAEDPKVAHEIVSFQDGTISIKSEYYKRFWRILTEQHNFIVVDADGPSDAKYRATGMFRVIPVDINVFAIVSMNPSMFVKWYDPGPLDRPDSVATKEDHISQYVRIEVVALDELHSSPQQKPTKSTNDLPAI